MSYADRFDRPDPSTVEAGCFFELEFYERVLWAWCPTRARAVLLYVEMAELAATRLGVAS